MKESLVVSDRGQVTLPAAMRRLVGITRNSVLTAEAVDGRIVLTPAIVVETELYSDQQIREWNRADAFARGERAKLAEKLKKRRG